MDTTELINGVHCFKCRIVKTEENCNRYVRKGYTGFHTYCKPCDLAYQRELRVRHPEVVRARDTRKRLKTYGLTLQDYNNMEAAQNRVCAICKSRPDVNKRLHVDHNHTTGKVRALLCAQCNHALGSAKESPTILAEMILYLEKYSD